MYARSSVQHSKALDVLHVVVSGEDLGQGEGNEYDKGAGTGDRVDTHESVPYNPGGVFKDRAPFALKEVPDVSGVSFDRCGDHTGGLYLQCRESKHRTQAFHG